MRRTSPANNAVEQAANFICIHKNFFMQSLMETTFENSELGRFSQGFNKKLGKGERYESWSQLIGFGTRNRSMTLGMSINEYPVQQFLSKHTDLANFICSGTKNIKQAFDSFEKTRRGSLASDISSSYGDDGINMRRLHADHIDGCASPKSANEDSRTTLMVLDRTCKEYLAYLEKELHRKAGSIESYNKAIADKIPGYPFSYKKVIVDESPQCLIAIKNILEKYNTVQELREILYFKKEIRNTSIDKISDQAAKCNLEKFKNKLCELKTKNTIIKHREGYIFWISAVITLGILPAVNFLCGTRYTLFSPFGRGRSEGEKMVQDLQNITQSSQANALASI